MRRQSMVYAGLAILLLLFCFRLWNIAPTHTDDAVWRLHGIKGNWLTIHSWAVHQGRVFAYVTGMLIYWGCATQESLAGPLLQLGSFLIFFTAFYYVIGLYCGRQTSLLAAVLNLATFALRWEGSVMTTYPLFCWVLSTLFVASIYLSRRYSLEGRLWCLPASLVLLFVSLNIHESMSVLFGLLAILAVLVHGDWKKIASSDWALSSLESKWKWHLLATAGLVCSYFALYAGWRLAFPSTYAGNRLGSLNPLKVFPVLASLSSSGSVVWELARPYSVVFADAVNHDGYRVSYKPLYYLRDVSLNSSGVLYGAIVATLFYLLTTRRSVRSETTAGTSTIELFRSVVAGIAVGLLPVLPVALVGKYQEHYYDLHVGSYLYTPVCHFGWTLLAASLLCQLKHLRSVATRQAILGVFAVLLGILSYCATLRNDAVAADMRRETCRWTVLRQMTTILPRLERSIAVIQAPRLASGSWFTCVTPDYWSGYVKECYGINLRFEPKTLTTDAIKEGVAIVDYVSFQGNTQTVVFVAPLELDESTGQVFAGEIAVSAPFFDPSDRAQFLLTYNDLDTGKVVRRFSSLTEFGRYSVLSVKGCRAIPASIRIDRSSQLQNVQVEGARKLQIGNPVWFSLEGERKEGGGLVTDWLVGKWHPIESGGTWSAAKESEIHVPMAQLPRENLTFTLQASTYTGLGFHNEPQELQVRIRGRNVATHTFVRGSGWRDLTFEVLHSDLPEQGALIIQLALEEIANPAQLGIATDARDLGTIVRKLTVNHGMVKITK